MAAVGIGAVSYVIARGDTTSSSGNLMPPDDAGQPKDARRRPRELGQPHGTRHGRDRRTGRRPEGRDTSDVVSSGNLMPPPDAGTDGSSDAGGD
ncbi:MAG: hypothetical protein U0235_26550 [Polyangiaceae bacterium]